MFVARRPLQRFVTINMRQIQKSERRRITWQQLMFSSTMFSHYNIPRVLKGDPRIEALYKDIDNMDPNEEWYIADMLKLLSTLATEGYYSSPLLEDLHKILVKYANSQQFLQDDIFYALSEFMDNRSNIPLLKNGRLQAYSRLYSRLDPFQREIILRDYLETHRVGEFVSSYLEDIDKDESDFQPIELQNRNTKFQFAVVQLKNMMNVQKLVTEVKYWSQERLLKFQKILDNYLSMLEDVEVLRKLIAQYQTVNIFLPGLNIPSKNKIILNYKKRLAKIIDTMYSSQYHGLLIPRDEIIDSVIMSNFSRNDRALLRPALEKICEQTIRRFPTINVTTLQLMEYFNFVHKGFLYTCFLSFLNKMKASRNVHRTVIYKTNKEILQAGVAFQKLKFKQALKDLASKQELDEFVNLYVLTLRVFVFSEKNNLVVEEHAYVNLLPDSYVSHKVLGSHIWQQARLSESIHRLIHQERSLLISPMYQSTSDIRTESQLPQLGVFIVQLQALQTVLILCQDEVKFGSTAFKEMTNNIMQMRTCLNYICMPRVLETIIRIANLSKTKLKTVESRMAIDDLTSKRVVQEFNNVWNNLDSVSQTNGNSFRPNPLYLECLLDINVYLAPPMLNCGKILSPVYNGVNVNFSSNFACNENNILQNVNTNKLLPILYETSVLKTAIENSLTDNDIRFTKNYVDYPYFADFLIEGPVKTVVYSIDYTKLYMGSPDTTIRAYDNSVEYFQSINYRVVNIHYRNLVEGKLQAKTLQAIRGQDK